MVSAEQRWNESRRAYNNAAQTYHQALQARNIAIFLLRTGRSSNVGMTNREVTQARQRAQANVNRAQANLAAATTRSRNAYRNLTRKYHLPISLPVETLNAVLMNIVRNKKANVRQRARIRTLSETLPPNLAARIVSFLR